MAVQVVRCGIPDPGGGQRETIRAITGEIPGPKLDEVHVISTDSQITDPVFADFTFGAKGIGEPSIVAAGPAVAAAVKDAVGIEISKLPVTPEDIYWKIHKKQTT